MKAVAVILVIILALVVGMFAGISLAAPRARRTCAIVPNGIVCWSGLRYARQSVS